MPAVSVFMDVEDPVNPLADDAALEFARLFTEAGVRGSFCLTGEKCRTLLQRERADVLDAFRPHSLGLHTDTHSYHPTTMELLADVDWSTGCVAAYETERKGFVAFEAAFGRPPSYWGGAGNTWSPEITDALKLLKIPAYVYALTEFPNGAVHRFNGVFALPQSFSISESDWMDDERAAKAVERTLGQLREFDQPWVGLFVGHPTRMRYSQFWDAALFAGHTPERPVLTDPVTDDEYDRAKVNLAAFLKRLREDFTVVGIEEALGLSWQLRDPSPEEKEHFTKTTARNLCNAATWPVHRKDLNPTNIVAKTLALADSAQIAYIAS